MVLVVVVQTHFVRKRPLLSFQKYDSQLSIVGLVNFSKITKFYIGIKSIYEITRDFQQARGSYPHLNITYKFQFVPIIIFWVLWPKN